MVEAMKAGCVPVFLSSWLPPFSRILDWSTFSVRIPSLDLVPQLKAILLQQPHERLSANLPLALDALWYRATGGYGGDDMLPFLLVEMAMALQAAEARPLRAAADELLGLPLSVASFDDDVTSNRSVRVTDLKLLPARIAAAVKPAPHAYPPAYRAASRL